MSGGFSGPKPAEIRGGLGVDRNISSEVVPTASQAGAFSQQDKQNNGYSGTPMWKIALERQKEQQAAAATAPTIKIPEGFAPVDKITATRLSPLGQWYYSEKRQVFWSGLQNKMYVFDHVSGTHKELHDPRQFELQIAVGSCFHEKASQVRHLLVKDLTKAASVLRMSIEHLDRPCALYALYDGHRGGPGAGGDVCADFCAKHLHQKLLPKLAAFRGHWEHTRLETAMRESCEELDAEFAEKHPTAVDGCSAAVALLIGQRLVLASLGDVACILCMRNGEAKDLIKAHVVRGQDDDDDDDSEDDDDAAAPANQGADEAAGPAPIRWTRAFGDLEFKRPGSSPKLSVVPDCTVVSLVQQHFGIALVCRGLYNAIGRSGAVSTVSKRSGGRPRMAAGALVDAAVQWLGQVGDVGLGSVVAFFDKIEDSTAPSAPPRKKGRTVPSQVRLRHIMLKHRECKSSIDKVRNKQVKRTRGEAERLLRAVLEECESDPKRKVFAQRCKDMSECTTSLSGGDLAGDLGWMRSGTKGPGGSAADRLGPAFEAAAFLLQVGQLSDLIDSDQGIHIILRSA